MNWSFIFEFSKYLGIALIVGSIILRYFKKFPLHVPIIIGLLLLVSIGGSFALKIAQMTNAEISAYFGTEQGDVEQLRLANAMLQYLAVIVVSVVYISAVFEGITSAIRLLYRLVVKKWKNRKMR